MFTLLSIAVAFLLYGLLAAVKNGFEASGNLAGVDRLISMAKVSIVQPLPISYLQRIASVPGVKLVTHSTWFGGHYQNENNVIITYPVPPESYLEMYTEFLLPPAQFVAPRFDVLAYVGYIGTSQATPHVAGVAAMLMQQGITSPAAIEAALEKFATHLGDPGRNQLYGFGMVDARKTLLGLGLAR